MEPVPATYSEITLNATQQTFHRCWEDYIAVNCTSDTDCTKNV